MSPRNKEDRMNALTALLEGLEEDEEKAKERSGYSHDKGDKSRAEFYAGMAAGLSSANHYIRLYLKDEV